MTRCSCCNTDGATEEYGGAEVDCSVLSEVRPGIYSSEGKFYQLISSPESDPYLIRVSHPDIPLRPIGEPEVLTPGYVALVGGRAYCYWPKRPGTPLSFCSRKCAMSFAKRKTWLLIRLKDSIAISPHEDEFDHYAVRNNDDSQLAHMSLEPAASEEIELRNLMRCHPNKPDRIRSLADHMFAHSEYELANQAVEFLLKEYPAKAIDSSMLLAKLDRFEDIDRAYEACAGLYGGRSEMTAAYLSQWASFIMGWNYDKALSLSDEAAAKSPASPFEAEHRLVILALRHPEKAIEYFRTVSDLIATDSGFYTIGTAFLRQGMLPEAEEHLRVADLLAENRANKAHLAETLFRLERYAEALKIAEDGLKKLERFTPKSFGDCDGKERIHSPEWRDLAVQNSGNLLLIKGKALIAIGETRGGRECIQDALNAGGEKLAKSLFCDGVDTANYVTTASLNADIVKREQITKEILADLAQMRAHLKETEQEKEELSAAGKRASIKSELLSDIISGVCKAEEDWEAIRQNPKYRDCKDLVDDVFSNDIHTLCMELRQRDGTLYSAILKKFKGRFQVLNEKQPLIIKFIASAEFIMKCHRLEDEGRVAIFAGPVVELGKAIELCLNRYLLEPFQEHLLLVSTGGGDPAPFRPITPKPEPRYDSQLIPKPFFVIEGRKKCTLKTYQLESLLRCDDERWLNFCHLSYPPEKGTSWIRETLPGISENVRKLRNPAAHDQVMDLTQAETVKKLLEDNKVFENFEALAKSKLSKDARRFAHNHRDRQARGGSSLSSSKAADQSCSKS
jgi:tetratricopeptide (TPR) repeat protein